MTIWAQVGKHVSVAAPLLGGALGGPAGAALGGLVAAVLGTEATPSAVAHAVATDPEATAKLQALERAHALELKRLVLAAETRRLGEINRTMRAELVAEDAYTRRWRPTYGYATSLTWILQSVALAWAMVANPEHADEIVAAVVALTPMWGIALAVLGINVHQRSQDKQVAAGLKPATLLAGLARRAAP